MPYSACSLRLSVLLVGLVAAHVCTASPIDRIFASGFTSALVIEGSAGYPGPLAGAQVEAHFGDAMATTATASDGTYRVGIEIEQIAPGAIVELFARGVGSQTGLTWASLLGPADRLLEIADVHGRVGFAQEPFVHLSPRSTVVAAAARGYNHWQPIADASTFWRAIRARDFVSSDLIYALALVARGAIPLPNGTSDTFEAVSSSGSAQFLHTSYWSLLQGENCLDFPQTVFCDVDRNLPLDPRMFPPLAWTVGELYSSITAFRTPTLDAFAFRPQNDGVTVITATGASVPSTTTTNMIGDYEVAPIDPDVVYTSRIMRSNVGNDEVSSLWEATRLHIRVVQGPANQIEFAWSPCWRISYPENPEIPTREWPCYGAEMPMPSSNNPLPAELADRVPTLAGHRWVLPSPLTRIADASIDSSLHGYDIHGFNASNATAERSGQSFSYAEGMSATFSLDGGGESAEFRFFNEEEPNVWRVLMHVSGGGRESVVEGLLIPADAGPLTVANSTGAWTGRGYGDDCLGAYAEFTCSSGARVEVDADGSATQVAQFGFVFSGHWNLGGGHDSGRLLFDWQSPENSASVLSRFGWELVHESGNRRWVLQTRTSDVAQTGSAPPIVFNPTMWLIRYDRL